MVSGYERGTALYASNRSPMRRGLKQRELTTCSVAACSRFKPIPDEEGTETKKAGNVRWVYGLQASNRSPMRRGLKRDEVDHVGLQSDPLQTDPR